MSLLLIQGSASRLPLADESVQCVVTSPPYWGLRQYAGEQREVWGGDQAHAHEWSETPPREAYVSKAKWQHSANGRGEEQPTEKRLRDPVTRSERPEAWGEITNGAWCACGAWYGALGREPTPELYVEHMVAIFREVRRVLRKDGTLWLNLGDSYAGSWGAQGRTGQMADRSVVSARQIEEHPQFGTGTGTGTRGIGGSLGLKPKDLVMMPFEVARALRIDGWWVRSDIIWHKSNPMPESVTDRPTKAHEYVFLLAKSKRYYFDADAIREPMSEATATRLAQPDLDAQEGGYKTEAYQANHTGRKNRDRRPAEVLRHMRDNPLSGRNKRTVWAIPTRPYPGAHFATYPEQLVEPCVLAGSRPGDVVLDPFNGSGTTGRVAIRHGRRYVGVDISSEYLREQATQRIDNIQHVMDMRGTEVTA